MATGYHCGTRMRKVADESTVFCVRCGKRFDPVQPPLPQTGKLVEISINFEAHGRQWQIDTWDYSDSISLPFLRVLSLPIGEEWEGEDPDPDAVAELVEFKVKKTNGEVIYGTELEKVY